MPAEPPLGRFGPGELPRPCIVGILNVTPDSFSDGGSLPDAASLLARARAHVAGGARVLDVGGESTRPGFAEPTLAEELARVVAAVRTLVAANLPVAISVDTRRAAVAAATLGAGAHVINDVSALSDPAMAGTVARFGAGLVLMHGFRPPQAPVPATPARVDDVWEVVDALAKARDAAWRAGVARGRVWLDPGVGFAKDMATNLRWTAQLGVLRSLGCPIYFGPSRKAFLGAATGHHEAAARDAATAASCAIAVAAGADLVRVHNPAACRDAVAVASAVRRAGGLPPAQA